MPRCDQPASWSFYAFFSLAIAIAVTFLLALLARAMGWIERTDVTGERPFTGFSWRPDKWTAVVAVLAGCAGVLSQTAGRSNALVGVFISVTTVPEAGDFALSLALGAGEQLSGAPLSWASTCWA